MKNVIQIAIALFISTAVTAEARSIMMCAQVAGIAKHRTTGECRSFTNGCVLNDLQKSGFEVAAGNTCQDAQEFGKKEVAAASVAETSIIGLPSTVTMVCDGQNTKRSAFMHVARLTVVTGRALASGKALIEVTQAATNAKFQPLALLADMRHPDFQPTGTPNVAGRYYENTKEEFQLFIPEIQPLDTPYLRATLRMGSERFVTRCRTLGY
ncbi:MAG: hypothetical protein K2X47_04900 [Bdellovibrionales bacterium]|nr:hypothetical protein [Bdellovibrionales bacterium]